MGRQSLLFPILSGAALWLSFPNFSFFWLAWVALVPFLLFCLDQKRLGRVVAGHFLMGAVYFGATLYWIPNVLIHYGHLDVVSAYGCHVLLTGALSVLLLPFTLLFYSAARRSAGWALLCAPGLWLGTELSRNYFPANGFPWASLGYSQAPFTTLIQAADLGSVYVLSFLVVAVNAAIVAWVKLGSRKWPVGVAALFVAANLYGACRLYIWEVPEEESLSVAVIQGNIRLAETSEYYRRRYFVDLARSYREESKAGARLVVFPEAQNPYLFPDDRLFAEFWTMTVRQSGSSLLFNGTALDRENLGGYFNSAHLLDTRGNPSYRYDKVHLVPFGEYLPFRDWLSFARPLVAEVSNFTPGNELSLGTVEGISFATLICYEGIFPELSREFARRGAKILFNLSNDSWFGDTAAPEQHLQMGRFRAVETRRTLVRGANSGYSAVISPKGEVLHKTPLFEEAVLRARVVTNSYTPPAVVLGDWPALTLIIVSVFLFLIPHLRPRQGEGVRE